MGNKRNKPSPVINVDRLNLDIDYNKLAEAIVNAEEKAQKGFPESCKKANLGFFSAILCILKGEKSKDGRFLSAPFIVILSVLYRTLASLGIIVVISAGISAGIVLSKMNWQGWQIVENIVLVIYVIGIVIAVFLYSVVFWGAANDIEHEKDKNFVISVFSGIVSFAALIVAVIALVRA